MREQMERLLRDFDLPSLNLGILSSTVEVAGVPEPAFSIFETDEGRRADYELVSRGVDITDPSELALHDKAFEAINEAASYGDAAKELISKALDHWSR